MTGFVSEGRDRKSDELEFIGQLIRDHLLYFSFAESLVGDRVELDRAIKGAFDGINLPSPPLPMRVPIFTCFPSAPKIVGFIVERQGSATYRRRFVH